MTVTTVFEYSRHHVVKEQRHVPRGMPFSMLAFGTLSWATTDITLIAAKAHPNATGTATFSDHGLSIHVCQDSGKQINRINFQDMLNID